MSDKTASHSNKESFGKDLPAAKSGEFLIGGDMPVWRLGFGAMRITGKGVWGEPKDHDEAIRVLRRVVELGINFIDTADSYGPEVSERLIAEALHPYPEGLVIATKAGFDRSGPDRWTMNGKPEHLRQACEGSLRRLKLDRIDLFQLHRIDPAFPAEDQLGTLRDLQAQGKIRHIGLSEVSVKQIEHARKIVPIVSVQNRYSVADRAAEDVLEYLRARKHRLYPVVSVGSRTTFRTRRQTRAHRRGVEDLHFSAGARLVALALSDNAAHSGNLESESPRGKRSDCRHKS